MGHITQQSERDENQAIWDCPYRDVPITYQVLNDWTGEYEDAYGTESQCGEMITLSVAKDKCVRCGKIFTY